MLKNILKIYSISIIAMMATVVNAGNLSTNMVINQNKAITIQTKLAKLEASFDGKIGLYAINTENGEIIQNRANERFPFQSTMKLIAVSTLLKQSEQNKGLLQEIIHYTKNDIENYWSPVTRNYLENGMTLEALSEAAMSFSDNTATNRIIKKLGGPQMITKFAHSIGNTSFNLEHYEGSMNSNPKNTQDTSTPHDMALSLQKLTLGNTLSEPLQTQLVSWMKLNTTSYKRMRAGTPIGWVVADKTGSGDYGIANDIGIMWSPSCKPIVLAIYTVRNKQNAKGRDDILASTTSAVLDKFAHNDTCISGIIK